MKVRTLSLVAVALLGLSQTAFAENKIGFVNSDRVMREAAPAVRAQQRLEKEFEKRDQELQRIARDLKSMQEDLERNGPTMGDSDRRNKERDLNELSRDFQRKQREFREDLNLRQNEENAAIIEKANKAIKQLAENEKFDLIVQDVVWASPKLDITDKIIKALAADSK